MNARIVFLLTLLALVQHIDGRHTIWAQLFDEPDETCSVTPEHRNDCGWYGIDQATCEGRGCCYDDTGSDDTIWCFYPTDNKCYGIDPQEREECGYSGIQREECENDNGCCFDHTVQNVPWCFKGTGPVTEAPTEPATEAPTLGETCRVEPDDRNDCGWYGIDRATCEGRGCCYDNTGSDDTIWCFYPTDNKCYGIDPQEREECGYYGIQREECENDNGCCFDHTVQNVPWCFKGTGPVTEVPTEQATEAPTAGPETEAPETEEENEEVSLRRGLAVRDQPLHDQDQKRKRQKLSKRMRKSVSAEA